jgi:hypothetical protein
MRKEIRTMSARMFAIVFGVIYLAAGLLGFVPALRSLPADAPPITVTSGYGYLLGLFPINLLHNLVHLAIGVWGVLAYRSFPAARLYARGLAVIYGVLTVFGLIPGLNTLFGLTPLFGHDVWLHALTAVIAAWFGWKAIEPVPAGTR